MLYLKKHYRKEYVSISNGNKKVVIISHFPSPDDKMVLSIMYCCIIAGKHCYAEYCHIPDV